MATIDKPSKAEGRSLVMFYQQRRLKDIVIKDSLCQAKDKQSSSEKLKNRTGKACNKA